MKKDIGASFKTQTPIKVAVFGSGSKQEYASIILCGVSGEPIRGEPLGGPVSDSADRPPGKMYKVYSCLVSSCDKILQGLRFGISS
jgi:hypothetical protein